MAVLTDAGGGGDGMSPPDVTAYLVIIAVAVAGSAALTLSAFFGGDCCGDSNKVAPSDEEEGKPTANKVAKGGAAEEVKPLHQLEFNDTGMERIDAVFQSAGTLNNRVADLNDGLHQCVDNVLQACGNPRSGLKAAVKSTLALLSKEAATRLFKASIPKPDYKSLASEGRLDFEFAEPEEIIDSLKGCEGIDDRTLERVKAVLQFIPGVVGLVNETLPAIQEEVPALVEKAKDVSALVTDPEALKDEATQAGIIGGNPISDGMKIVSTLKTLKGSSSSCGKVPENVKIVIANVKFTTTAVVEAFHESKADILGTAAAA